MFFSKAPGLVAWCIRRDSDLINQAGDIRRFALDADLILGALRDSTTLVIIGREREQPLEVLPPLRVETVLLIASISAKELSQSLDINDCLAGTMPDGRDWCPTYLSRELENTEFGDLMTITDVLLKDWKAAPSKKRPTSTLPPAIFLSTVRCSRNWASTSWFTTGTPPTPCTPLICRSTPSTR